MSARHRLPRVRAPYDAPAELWDELPDGVLIVAADGEVLVFNAAAVRISERAAADVVGRHVDAALDLRESDGRSWWGCLDLAGLRTRTGHPERTVLLHNGREVLVTARFSRTRARGEVTRVAVGLRDTHARARDERNQAELVSTVAHELRSPLTSVKGFTATLLAKWDRFTDEQKRLMLETVDADADRVTRLITELLDIARIDSGRLVVRSQALDLAAMARRHFAGVVASGLPGERFVVRAQPGLPEVWGDSDKIDQVLANLLENAVRHGAGAVTIDIRAAQDGMVAVCVLDEGEGVPADAQARAFTKFWRAGGRGGTGLGLYIVRGLVEAHGGLVTIISAPGSGACFRFTLPAGTPEFAR